MRRQEHAWSNRSPQEASWALKKYQEHATNLMITQEHYGGARGGWKDTP